MIVGFDKYYGGVEDYDSSCFVKTFSIVAGKNIESICTPSF